MIASIYFTTVKVWTNSKLRTFHLPLVMELKTRVDFACCPINRNKVLIKTVAVDLTNHEDEFRRDSKYLVMNRDTTLSSSFIWGL